MKGKLYSFLAVVSILFFAFLAGFALLHPGLPPSHDGEYHVIRFFLFDEALRDGNFYPRWAAHLNNGFGVPLFNFVYPLPNYVASILHLANISFIDSFKISMLVATIIGGVFFYLWSREFWGRLGGVVSSIFYTFSPYHFVDIYIRGSVGEVWALGFFPAFLWAYTKFVKSKRKVFLILSSIFLALIIFSHNILALMFFVFSLSYIVFLISKEKSKKYLILNTIYLILLGLGLSAIFWLPAIYETKYVTGLQIFDVTSKFPELYQLLIPSWGSGFSGTGIQNELSYQVGAANLLAIFLSMMVITLQIKRESNKLPCTLFFFACFIFSFAIFLIFTAFILGIGYTKPAYYHDRTDNYYITRSNFIDGTNSIGNVFNTIYLKSIPAKEKERAIFIKGSGKIALEKAKSNLYSFTIQADKNSEIQINLSYFPGWEVYINDKKESLKLTQNGRFAFPVSRGKNKAEIVFNDTLIRKVSAFISITSLGLMIALLISKRFVTIKK